MTVSKEAISDWLFHLFLRREIFSRYEAELKGLASLCSCVEEFELISHAVEQMIALSNQQYNTAVDDLARRIREQATGDEKVAITAMAYGSEPDSSQLLLQCLKHRLRDLHNITFFNSVNNFKKHGNANKYNRIILIDDFSGTGLTVLNRIKDLEMYASSNNSSIEISALLLFGMEGAKSRIEAAGKISSFYVILKAGISGYFEGDELIKRIDQMKRLESELAPSIDEHELPTFGFGRAESLFFIVDQNAPNSNFPIFWWPRDKHGSDRVTLMVRSGL